MVLMYSHACEMTNCNGHIRELIECCPYILINTTLDIRCAHTWFFLNDACARPCIEWNSFLKLCWLWFCGMTNWCGHIVLLAHMLVLVCKSSECAKFEALCSGLNINNCPPPSWALLSGTDWFILEMCWGHGQFYTLLAALSWELLATVKRP